jgi:hypothetical protein
MPTNSHISYPKLLIYFHEILLQEVLSALKVIWQISVWTVLPNKNPYLR